MRLAHDESRLRGLLVAHRAELIDRCRIRVAARCAPPASPAELEQGVPLFLDRLTSLLPGGKPPAGKTAAAAGSANPAAERRNELQRGGFTIEQLVHDHDELRRSITELAFRKGVPLTTGELTVLDIGLNRTIASASREILHGRAARQAAVGEPGQRLESVASEMRNLLNTSCLAFAAIKAGGVGFNGATAAALDRSLDAMRGLMDRILDLARLPPLGATPAEAIDLAAFILDVQVAAEMRGCERSCELTVLPVEEGVLLEADQPILAAAVTGLVVHALDCGLDAGVVLSTCSSGGRVFIEVRYESEFEHPADIDSRLALCRTGVSASGGEFRFRSFPGGRRVATIDLPRSANARTDRDLPMRA